MSRNTDSNGPDRTSATLQKIEQAILRVGAIRQQYIDQCQTGPIPAELRKEFHAAVINYYVELRPFRDHDYIETDWREVPVPNADQDGDADGLENLLAWVDKTRPSQQDAPGRGKATKSSREPDTLPARRLLQISMALDDIAHKLGFAPDGETPVADPTEARV